MTIQDCIDYVDSIEPNAYNNAQKAAWINEVEGKVYTQLFLAQPYEFKAANQALALPAPYDRMYSRYLQAMIHYANGEYDRYANSMALFNEVWAEANRWFGGDFDVTDRLRNQKIVVPLTQLIADRGAISDAPIFDIPEGCAIVAGRITVKYPMIVEKWIWYTPESMPAGTYRFWLPQANRWRQFTTAYNHAAGVRIDYDLDRSGADDEIGIADSGANEHLAASYGSSGTEINPYTLLNILVNDQKLCTLDPTERGTTPLPMIMAEEGGDGLRIERRMAQADYTKWRENPLGSDIFFTGRLLIPDERWSYDPAYAGRRDARWRG